MLNACSNEARQHHLADMESKKSWQYFIDDWICYDKYEAFTWIQAAANCLQFWKLTNVVLENTPTTSLFIDHRCIIFSACLIFAVGFNSKIILTAKNSWSTVSL